MFAIGDQHFIDELATVVGIDPQNRKREERACASEGRQDRLLAPMQERKAFRPSGGHIGERQRVDIPSLDVSAIMSHEICFQKAGSGLLPLLEGADRDLLAWWRGRADSPFAGNAVGGPLWLRSWKAVGGDTPP